MASDLPIFMTFGFNRRSDNILRIMRLNPSSRSLRFDRGAVLFPDTPTSTKFELQPAKAGNGRFTHIRSCYNNKYLSRRSSGSHDIRASADQPEEDQSNWSCTLFELLGNSGTFKLRHVATGRMAVVHNQSLALYNPAGSGPEYDEFSIVDWSSIVIFPNFVMLKGDNGMYLSAEPRDSAARFIEEDDITNNKSMMYRVDYQNDGSVLFYAIKSDCYLRRMLPGSADVDAVWASRRGDAIFQPRKVQRSSNKVVLQNLGNNKFCARTTRNQFRANSNQANLNTSILDVNEAVLSRSIYNVRYRLSDARIYNEAPNPVTTTTNNETSSNMEKELTFEYKIVESTAWGHSVNVESEVKTTFVTGVPFIVGGQVSVSVNVGYERTWGKTETTTKELEITHMVVVPPRTSVTVTLVATKGACDIPFNYTRRDILMDGRQVITVHDDGLYTGVSHYNFKYETTRRDL